jgi:hypothetical protein
MEYRVGTIRVHRMNWRSVRPREIFARKVPTKGPQEIHQPQ